MASAVAHRYASAMAEVASKPGAEANLDATLEQLRAFAGAYTSSAELRNVLAAPSVAVGQKQELVTAIGSKIGLARPVRNLLFVMMDHRRLRILDEVIEALEKRRDEQMGVERLEVISALPMPDDQRGALVERFRAATGKQVEASFKVDEALLGGAVIRLDGTLIDGSLASQLRSLSQAMSG